MQVAILRVTARKVILSRTAAYVYCFSQIEDEDAFRVDVHFFEKDGAVGRDVEMGEERSGGDPSVLRAFFGAKRERIFSSRVGRHQADLLEVLIKPKFDRYRLSHRLVCHAVQRYRLVQSKRHPWMFTLDRVRRAFEYRPMFDHCIAVRGHSVRCLLNKKTVEEFLQCKTVSQLQHLCNKKKRIGFEFAHCADPIEGACTLIQSAIR